MNVNLEQQNAASGSERVAAMVDEHGAALVRYATRLTGDSQLAQDIVQESFIRALRHIDHLGIVASTRGWLFTVVRNLVVDHARARAVRPVVANGGEVLERSSRSSSSDHSSRVVDRLTVAALLHRLPEIHREVLVLVYWRQMSVAEAAAVLAVPAGTVKSRTFYALKSLREVIETEDIDLGEARVAFACREGGTPLDRAGRDAPTGRELPED